VKEAFWFSETWRRNHLHYYPYYGRGYVQLTWKRNYEQYSHILRIDMTADPGLQAGPALFVLVHGFKTGTFTGRRLSEIINAGATDFKNARRCVNGLEKWHEIQTLAETYVDDL
jgi:predicted chitinase